MERYDKGTGQGTGEIKVDVCSPIVGHITPLDHALLLQLLVGELVRAKDLVLLLLTGLAFGLTSHVVQVALVRVELAHEVRVMVPNRLVNFLELLRLGNNTIFQGAQML